MPVPGMAMVLEGAQRGGTGSHLDGDPYTPATAPAKAEPGMLQLPDALRKDLGALAKEQDCEVGALAVDMLREMVEERSRQLHDPKTALAEGVHHPLEMLVKHHLRFPWADVVICLDQPLDADDCFFPVVIKHIINGTRLYYVHPTPRVTQNLIERIESVLDPETVSEAKRLVVGVSVNAHEFDQVKGLVLFDWPNEELRNGYRWTPVDSAHKTGSGEKLTDQEVQNAVRYIKKQLVNAPVSAPESGAAGPPYIENIRHVQ